MTPLEASIQNIKKMKGQPLKKQIEYIVTNFWLPIVVILVLIISAVSLAVHWATMKPTALSVCCVNIPSESGQLDGYLQDFAGAQGIDTQQYQLDSRQMYLGSDAEADYETVQVFNAMLAAGDMDVLVSDYETLISCAYQELCADLSQTLTQEQMDTLAPHFLYIDMAFLKTIDPFSQEEIQFPDPAKPEQMERPVPVAIMLQPEWEFTQACSPYAYKGFAVALFSNGKNAANGQAFLQYILEQKES